MIRRLSFLLLLLLAPATPLRAAGSCDGPALQPEESLAHALEARVQALALRSGPFELTMSEREATSVLALRLSALGLREPQLRFLPGLACLSARVVGLLPLAARLQVSAEAGRPEIQVKQARLGPLELPPFARRFLSGVVRDSLVRAPGVTIEHVELVQGSMTIRGRLRPSP